MTKLVPVPAFLLIAATQITISRMIFMALSSWLTAIARVHPAHLMNPDCTPGGYQPLDQAI